jgi:hypothetical protein
VNDAHRQRLQKAIGPQISAIDDLADAIDLMIQDQLASHVSPFPSVLPHVMVGNVGADSWARAVPGYGLRDDTPTVVSVSPGGFTAFQAYTRTSDTGAGNAGGMAAFGFGGYAENDNTIAVQTAYVMYLEGRRQAGTGTIHGQENNIVNHGALVPINPYYIGADGSSLNYWASAGRTDQGAQQDLTCIFGAVNNGAQWSKGFVIGANAIASGVIGAEFLTVAPGYAIAWSNPVNNDAKAFMRSDATASSVSGRIGLIFTNTGAVVQTPDGVASLDVRSGKVTTTNLDVSGNLHALGALTVTGGAVFNSEADFAQIVRLSNRMVLNCIIAADDADAARKGVEVGEVYDSAGVMRRRNA